MSRFDDLHANKTSQRLSEYISDFNLQHCSCMAWYEVNTAILCQHSSSHVAIATFLLGAVPGDCTNDTLYRYDRIRYLCTNTIRFNTIGWFPQDERLYDGNKLRTAAAQQYLRYSRSGNSRLYNNDGCLPTARGNPTWLETSSA